MLPILTLLLIIITGLAYVAKPAAAKGRIPYTGLTLMGLGGILFVAVIFFGFAALFGISPLILIGVAILTFLGGLAVTVGELL